MENNQNNQTRQKYLNVRKKATSDREMSDKVHYSLHS